MGNPLDRVADRARTDPGLEERLCHARFRVWIDQDLCTGDGICSEIAPDVENEVELELVDMFCTVKIRYRHRHHWVGKPRRERLDHL